MDPVLIFSLIFVVIAILIMIAFPGSKGKSRRKRSKVSSKSTTRTQPAPARYDPTDDIYPYRLKDSIATPTELKFYMILWDAVGARGEVFAKIRLADLFTVNSNDFSEQTTYRNKIDRKHVDFLICDPLTLRPILGIELDDRSHRRQDRQDRDLFVDNVFDAAGLPLLRFATKGAYDREAIARAVHPYLGQYGSYELSYQDAKNEIPTAKPARSTEPSRTPLCPRCGSAMVLRTSTKSTTHGQQFWGCSTYPKCRGVVKVQPPPTP